LDLLFRHAGEEVHEFGLLALVLVVDVERAFGRVDEGVVVVLLSAVPG